MSDRGKRVEKGEVEKKDTNDRALVVAKWLTVLAQLQEFLGSKLGITKLFFRRTCTSKYNGGNNNISYAALTCLNKHHPLSRKNIRQIQALVKIRQLDQVNRKFDNYYNYFLKSSLLQKYFSLALSSLFF